MTDSALQRIRGNIPNLIYSSLPLVLFVGIYLASSRLATAIWSSVGAAVVILLVRLMRHEHVWPALAGFFGVAIAAFVAYRTGSARGFFLVDIWGSLLGSITLFVSVLVRWPLAGVVWSKLNGTDMRWRSGRSAQRYYGIATLLWALVLLARFGVLHWLYGMDNVGLLAFARIIMGVPFTAMATLVTIWAARKAQRTATSS